jgi:hypothetical protein
LYVSVESVANHDRAFWVKVVPTIDRTTQTKMKSISIMPNKHAYSCVKLIGWEKEFALEHTLGFDRV